MGVNNKFIPFLIIFLLSMGVQPIAADTFTGTGSSTTTTFVSVTYTKITWSYVAENEFDLFFTYIYKEGDSILTDSFDTNNGETFLYESGTFYFDVSAANIESWTITTQDTSGEYLASGDTITGSGNKNSKLFESFGTVTITWSYVAANEFDLFNVYIYKVGNILMSDSFSGTSGTSTLYGSGIYYLDITAANIESYSLSLDITPGDTTSDTTTPADADNVDDTDDGQTEPVNSPYIGIVMISLAILVKKKRM